MILLFLSLINVRSSIVQLALLNVTAIIKSSKILATKILFPTINLELHLSKPSDLLMSLKSPRSTKITKLKSPRYVHKMSKILRPSAQKYLISIKESHNLMRWWTHLSKLNQTNWKQSYQILKPSSKAKSIWSIRNLTPNFPSSIHSLFLNL